MRKLLAIIQIGVVLGLVCFSTFELFAGNFNAAMSTYPVVILLYLLLNAQKKRYPK